MSGLATLDRYADRLRGRMAFLLADEAGSAIAERRADEPCPAASVIKVPLVMALYAEAARGRLELDERLTVAPAVDGSGVLRHLHDAKDATLRDLATLTVIVSDNTATNRLIERVGMARVNEYLDEWGCRTSRLRRVMFDFDAALCGRENVMTPRETLRLFTILVRGDLVDRATSDAVLDVLSRNEDKSRLRRYLPGGTYVAHKSGFIAKVRNDAGIIRAERSVIAAGFCSELEREPAGDVALGLLGWCAFRAAGGDGPELPPVVEGWASDNSPDVARTR